MFLPIASISSASAASNGMDHVETIRSRNRAIIIFISAFVVGILVSSFNFVLPVVSLFIIVIAGAILIAERILNQKIEREIILVAIALSAFGMGSLRYAIKDFHADLSPSNQGIVVSEPEKKDQSTRFVFKSDNGAKALISTDMYSSVVYGDKVEVGGNFKVPEKFTNESGREFDYGKYLAKDDIYHTMSFAEVEILGKGEGNPVRHTLLRIKRGFVSKMKEILPEPESSLLAGLIVSGKDAMPKSTLEEFQRAGVVHIVVLSGYNLTIISDFLRVVFRNAAFSILGIVFFVIMTGAEATVVRASIMVLAVILAKVLKRNFSAPRALLVAAFIMLLENPKILVFDPSFQLSFLATCGLIFVSPIFEHYFSKVVFVPRSLGGVGDTFRTILSTTLATQLVVLPYLIYSMGNFSIVSLPANFLILFFIPLTMLMGFIATLLAFITPLIALPFSYITHILLAYILKVSEFLGNLSYASISVPAFSFWIIALIYVVLVSVISRVPRGVKPAA